MGLGRGREVGSRTLRACLAIDVYKTMWNGDRGGGEPLDMDEQWLALRVGGRRTEGFVVRRQKSDKNFGFILKGRVSVTVAPDAALGAKQ